MMLMLFIGCDWLVYDGCMMVVDGVACVCGVVWMDGLVGNDG